MYSTHPPFLLGNYFFRIFIKVLLVASTCSLAWGWLTEEK